MASGELTEPTARSNRLPKRKPSFVRVSLSEPRTHDLAPHVIFEGRIGANLTKANQRRDEDGNHGPRIREVALALHGLQVSGPRRARGTGLRHGGDVLFQGNGGCRPERRGAGVRAARAASVAGGSGTLRVERRATGAGGCGTYWAWDAAPGAVGTGARGGRGAGGGRIPSAACRVARLAVSRPVVFVAVSVLSVCYSAVLAPVAYVNEEKPEL